MNNVFKINKISLITKILLITVIQFFSHLSQGAPIPNTAKKVKLKALEQPINIFLQDLFGQLDLPVLVSPSVTGNVNASFDDSARNVLKRISRAFGVVPYYDGAVVHIYASADVTSRIYPIDAQVARRVIRNSNELRLTDAYHSLLQTQDGNMVAKGTRRFIEQIDELVTAARKTNDSEPPLSFRVFYLRYAWAQDVTVTFGGRQIKVPGVASILRSLLLSSPSESMQTLAQDRLLKPAVNGLKGEGLSSWGGDTESTTKFTFDQTDIKASKVRQNETLGFSTSGPKENQVSQSYSNQVRIEADTRLNAIIVRDTPERMHHYEQLIGALDVEPQSLEIEATIIDVNTDKLRELGINWRWSKDDDEVLFGRGDDSDIRLRPNTVVTPSGRGGFASLVLGKNDRKFVARINALEAEGAARIVSSPQLLTLSNVEAIFETSSTFYVRIAGNEEVDLYNVSTGTSLRVTPHVFKDDDQVRIKLLVTVEDGNLTTQQVDEIPIVERSAINTQALINAGESLLIGGMVRETKSEGVDKVPVLGDIPFIGNLFKSRTEGGQRMERMFLISPRLASSRTASEFQDMPDQDSSAERLEQTTGDSKTASASKLIRWWEN